MGKGKNGVPKGVVKYIIPVITAIGGIVGLWRLWVFLDDRVDNKINGIKTCLLQEIQKTENSLSQGIKDINDKLSEMKTDIDSINKNIEIHDGLLSSVCKKVDIDKYTRDSLKNQIAVFAESLKSQKQSIRTTETQIQDLQRGILRHSWILEEQAMNLGDIQEKLGLVEVIGNGGGIVGNVIDSETDEPVAAKILLTTLTDSIVETTIPWFMASLEDGSYSIKKLEPGMYEVKYEHALYESETRYALIRNKDTVALNVRLKKKE